METKEKLVRVKVGNKVVWITLDLLRGRETDFHFDLPKNGWDIEFKLESNDNMGFEEGSRLDLDWEPEVPLGIISFSTVRDHHTRGDWVETTPIGVVRVGLDNEFEIFWTMCKKKGVLK